MTEPEADNPDEEVGTASETDPVVELESSNGEDTEYKSVVVEEASAVSNKPRLEALEIEDDELTENELEAGNLGSPGTVDEDEAEREGLLSGSKPTTAEQAPSSSSRLAHRLGIGPIQRIGNMKIILPAQHAQTGWGMMGPHWFGPLCVIGIIWFASSFFVHESLHHVGLGTALICGAWTLKITFHLVQTSCRDPGVVTAATPRVERSRWCERCQAFQPPSGAHCPDCDVCVEGFDHHCVWMGTCIGRGNYAHFVRFNLAWLGYLMYAIVWVTLVGPRVFSRGGASGAS